MARIEKLLEKKSRLFTLIVTVIVSILTVPVFLPHIFHELHIFHIFLHTGGLILASFLSIISLIAYYRLRTKRMLLTSIAFSNFIIAESLNLIDSTWPTIYDIGDLTLLELAHLLTFVTLGVLALGVFRND